ncbi:MAG: GNAT family N-acetyltransferase [Acidimicrobiia bacterium]|nr:GNAT family N-acetyltransferase [Acidimicrobiia bacterium]
MDVDLRAASHADVPFLWQMLYEAVFWRGGPHAPSFEEALADPNLSVALADWGARDGDTAVVATLGATPVGAAWIRYYTDDCFINGFVEPETPVLVVAVAGGYRRRGIGGKLMTWLLDQAAAQSIPKVSLSVTKDNHALDLYRKQGFREVVDRGDSFLMVCEIGPHAAPRSARVGES